MPKITAIYRTGSPRKYTVVLDCGHKQQLTNAQVKKWQLYVGRERICDYCATQERVAFLEAEEAAAMVIPKPDPDAEQDCTAYVTITLAVGLAYDKTPTWDELRAWAIENLVDAVRVHYEHGGLTDAKITFEFPQKGKP